MNLSQQQYLAHKGTLSFSATLFTYIKVNVVAGFLFLPNGFNNGGYLFSILAIIILSSINAYCNIAVAACTDSAHSYSLSRIGLKALGKFGYYCTEFGIAISQVKLLLFI
jgi:amino acid permease